MLGVVVCRCRCCAKHNKLHPFTHELRISENGTQHKTVQVRFVCASVRCISTQSVSKPYPVRICTGEGCGSSWLAICPVVQLAKWQPIESV
jgi:hypothetical protein